MSHQLQAIREALADYEQGEDVDPLLVDAGLAPAPRTISHDEGVAWLLRERAKARKAQAVAQFLQGVETNQAHLRAGLSAFASATHFPQHPFTLTDKAQSYCQTCSAPATLDVDFVSLNRTRYLCGAVLEGDLAETAFFLEQLNDTQVSPPEHVPLTLQVFQMIRQLPQDTSPKVMLKHLRKIPGIRMSDEEARGFIDLLGHCGLLQTPEHPGLLYRFTNQGLAPSSSRSSDWSYPVDFWTARHGLDSGAMAYWFSDYPRLANV